MAQSCAAADAVSLFIDEVSKGLQHGQFPMDDADFNHWVAAAIDCAKGELQKSFLWSQCGVEKRESVLADAEQRAQKQVTILSLRNEQKTLEEMQAAAIQQRSNKPPKSELDWPNGSAEKLETWAEAAAASLQKRCGSPEDCGGLCG